MKLLVSRFGANTNTILDIAKNIKQNNNSPALPLLVEAQLKYCFENEMCITPADFFVRRTGALYFDAGLVKKWYPAVLNYMKTEFSWNEKMTEHFEVELRERAGETVMN